MLTSRSADRGKKWLLNRNFIGDQIRFGNYNIYIMTNSISWPRLQHLSNKWFFENCIPHHRYADSPYGTFPIELLSMKKILLFFCFHLIVVYLRSPRTAFMFFSYICFSFAFFLLYDACNQLINTFNCLIEWSTCHVQHTHTTDKDSRNYEMGKKRKKKLV